MRIITIPPLQCEECKRSTRIVIKFTTGQKAINVCDLCLKKALTLIEEAENESNPETN